MTLPEFLDHVLQITKAYNCGSSFTTLTPSILFFWNLWWLAETYSASFLSTTERRRRGNPLGNQWGQYCLKKMITMILVWSGGQCWSDGLIRFLKNYSIVFLLMVNNCLKLNHKMSQSTINVLETMLKSIICYSIVVLVRWCYMHIDRNYPANTRIIRSRRTRLYNWYTFVPRRQINELGENGRLLLENDLPVEPPQAAREENRNPNKLRYIHSCHLLTNKTPILSKQIKKRRQKSI